MDTLRGWLCGGSEITAYADAEDMMIRAYEVFGFVSVPMVS
jgi:hypothetical protein